MAQCRFGCPVAHVRVSCPDGCACFPGDVEQDLCVQHWMKMEPLGRGAKVVLVLNQVLAARLLCDKFYEWRPAPWDPTDLIRYFIKDDGSLVRDHLVTREELTKRRDDWLGKDFRWEIPLLPKGAKYVQVCTECRGRGQVVGGGEHWPFRCILLDCVKCRASGRIAA